MGPKYARPTVASPPAFKELTPADFSNTDGWKVAQPKDDALRGNWWEIFGDKELNALEDQVKITNQNIAAAAANFQVARSLVKQAESQYYPTLVANPSIANQRPSSAEFGGVSTGSGSNSGFALTSFTAYSLPFDATWEPDLWGRVRNTVRASVLVAQSSAADLQNVRLTAQAEVAVDYFQLRSQDAMKQLFDNTVAAYQDSLDLTQHPASRRHRLCRSRRAGRNAAADYAGSGHQFGDSARATRARHRSAGGPTGVQLF